MTDVKAGLASLYRRYNRREFVHPDPLELVYDYAAPEDQEIAGLVSACLAYGRVAQILASVARVLEVMGSAGTRGSPHAFLGRATDRELRDLFRSFKHRFTPGAEIAALLIGVKRTIVGHSSLEALFAAGMKRGDDTVLPALALFVERLRISAGGPRACPTLLSSPADGSACKRLNLYLRWMVRRDKVDPGPWHKVARSKLVVPLDTHMFRIARALGLTHRRQANLRTAVEITQAFARHSPRDPVRYDFCLTRLGINPLLDGSSLLRPLLQNPSVIEGE
ncbi:MAG: TIGR02757 family protein [Spirochaetia bacterium]